MAREKPKAAFAYLRTNSAANVGVDKNSAKRQREAIAAFAKRAGHEILAEFNDEAISGADSLESRPCFAAMLERIEANGCKKILVETAAASRARVRQKIFDGRSLKRAARSDEH